MTPAVQFDFFTALFRPLLTAEEAAFILDDCTERHVLDLLDEGKLKGVNVASRDDTKRMIRVWRYSALHWVMPRTRTAKLTDIPVEQLLGHHHRPTVLRRELAAWFACTEQHISNLGLAPYRPDSRHIISFPAVIDFLKARSI